MDLDLWNSLFGARIDSFAPLGRETVVGLTSGSVPARFTGRAELTLTNLRLARCEALDDGDPVAEDLNSAGFQVCEAQRLDEGIVIVTGILGRDSRFALLELDYDDERIRWIPR